ncbi:MAG: hypothetical protein HQK96_06915 [Nitrospirae bacterium]|nr:hypothetical protein [Nitrospirota bacterium]
MINDTQKETVRLFAQQKRKLGLAYMNILQHARRELDKSIYGGGNVNRDEVDWIIFSAISEFDAENILTGRVA